jgi:hypothetical protein
MTSAKPKSITPAELARVMYHKKLASYNTTRAQIMLYMAERDLMFDVRELSVELDPFNIFYQELGHLLGQAQAREDARAEDPPDKRKNRSKKAQERSCEDERPGEPCRVTMAIFFYEDCCVRIKPNGVLENQRNYEGFDLPD